MKKILLIICISLSINKVSAQCTDLIISKHFRFNGNTKAVEFYNTTSQPINLTAGHYSIERYKSTATGVIDAVMDDSLYLIGTVAAHSTWVLVNGQNAANSSPTSPAPDPNLQALANQLDHMYGTYGTNVGQPIYFKGNDCLVLRKNGVIIDVFGEVNQTVTTAWSSIAPYRGATGMGKWITTGYLMERKSTITSGRVPPIPNDLTSFNEFNPLAEFDTIPKILAFPTPTYQDTLNLYSHFGSHNCSCASMCNLSVVSQSPSQTVLTGSTAQFSVTASSNCNYIWQTNLGFGFQSLSNAGQYLGVNTNTLSINNAATNNNAQIFRCIISQGACADTSNQVILTVSNCAINVSNQPQNQTATVGTSAIFFFTALPSTASYQWQSNIGFGFQNLSNSGQYEGVTNDTLQVNNVAITNNNQTFRCIISTDATCIDTSNIATFSVIESNSIQKNNMDFIRVYPNPINDYLIIDCGKLKINKVEIHDLIGKVVISEKVENGNKINTTNLPKGIYFLKLGDNFGNIKLIKN